MTQSSFSGHGTYEIVIKGHLDEPSGYWFEDLTVACSFNQEGTPITTLSGPFVDQAALHGVLTTIRDLNLSLIGVWPVQDASQVESADPDQAPT